MKVYHILLLTFLYSVSLCSGYRILAIFTFDVRSHYGVLETLAKELAKKGHQVDVISNFPLKEPFPNYTDIIRIPTAGAYSVSTFDAITTKEISIKWLLIKKARMCNLLGHPEISKLIKNPPTDPPYDLVLTHVLIGYQCFNAIGYLWNVPVVMIATTLPLPQMQSFIGNPLNLAISSSHTLYYKEKRNFWDRLTNLVKTHRYIKEYHNDIAPNQDYLIKQHLGQDVPSYRVLEKNLALILSNSHYSFYGPKPKSPQLIEIGGIHIKNDTSILDPKLQKILDDSKDGFIYFSFGSLMAIESLPHETLEIIYKSLRRISPMKIIMRIPHPDDMPKNIPDNVIKFSWLPQQKILAHPNIKGFVSHGGGLGVQEGVYYGVPMICIPFFAEQMMNCDVIAHKNVGLKIDIHTAKKEDFDHAFDEIISNPKYKESMSKLSVLYRDRPRPPNEEAVYWIEYVIRHGKNVLRSSAVDLQWWQVELLDVYFFILVCAITIILISLYIIKAVLLFCFKNICKMGLSRSSKKLD